MTKQKVKAKQSYAWRVPEFLHLQPRAAAPGGRLTVERVQWLVSSLENRAASLTNTAKAFRMNVAKSWTWMKLRAQRSLLSVDREQQSNNHITLQGIFYYFCRD